jgi:hypothetical protein
MGDAGRLARGPAAAVLFAALALPATAPRQPAAAQSAAATAVAPPPPPAAAPPSPRCPPHAPQVRVEVEDPEPAVVGGADIDELHARTGRPRTERVHHLALTTSRVEWRSEITARYAQATPGGPVCAVPGEVTLVLAHAEHVVRLAREIPENGCLWREVMAHEKRHVAVNRRSLRGAAAAAQAAAAAWARQAEARGPDIDAAVGRLQRGLRRAIEPALARMRAEREAGHRAIDTREEYRRLARVCPADQSLLRQTLNGH